MKKIRIVTDKSGEGACSPSVKVYDTETGKQIHGIRKITWTAEVNDICKAEIEFVCVEVDVEAQTTQDVTALGDEYHRYVKA